MSPNQPKTPVTNFRLGDETREQIKRSADAWGVSMTEAVRKMAAATESMRKASAAFESANRAESERRHGKSEVAVEALADFLIERDWPSHPSVRTSTARRYEYRCMAAAILNGEAWAIKKAWPGQTMVDLYGMRDPSV